MQGRMSATQRPHDSRRAPTLALALVLPLALTGTAFAQSTIDVLRQRDQEREAPRTQQRAAVATQPKLKQEIDALGEDRRKLNQALIDTASRLRTVEARIGET